MQCKAGREGALSLVWRTQALTPAMEGWRKRISRIASSFEAANKDAAAQQPQHSQQQQQQQQRLHTAVAQSAQSSSSSSGTA